MKKKVAIVILVIVIIALAVFVATTIRNMAQRGSESPTTEASKSLPAQILQPVEMEPYDQYYNLDAYNEVLLQYSDPELMNTLPSTGPDVIPPILTSAVINGNVLTLSFDEMLNTSIQPTTSDFNVMFGSTNVPVASVAVMDIRTVLTLRSSATSDSVVTVTYTLPVSGQRIVDFGGNAAASFTRTATNTTPPLAVPTDTTAPVLSSARLSNKTLTLTYNETIDQNSVPANSAFTFQKSSGSTINITNVRITGSSVILTLDTNPGTGSMKIKYSVPSSNPIQDAAGNDAAAFSNQSVTVTTSNTTTNTTSNSNTTNSTARTNTTVTTNTPAQNTPPPTINTSDMSQTQLRELLNALQIRLNALIAARSAGSLGSSSASQTTTSGSSATSYTRSLRIGDTGADVTKLQKYLIAKGYLVVPASTTLGRFGRLTQSALIQFQLEKNISPASGIFGPITRAYITANP